MVASIISCGMRAIVLNGAIGPDALLDVCEEHVTRMLVAAGVGTDVRRLRDTPVAWCQGCFECWTHTPGICKIDDVGRDIAESFATSDLVVYLTPTTFGGYSSELKKALDRVLGVLLPFMKRIDGEVHHPPRYAQRRVLGVIASCGDQSAEAEATMRTLVTRNAINFATVHDEVAFVDATMGEDQVSNRCEAVIRRMLRALADPTSAPDTTIEDVDSLLPPLPTAGDSVAPPRRAMLLIGSAKPRGSSTSEALGRELLTRLERAGVSTTVHWVQRDAHSTAGLAALTADVRAHDLLVISAPLYIDSLPSLVTRALEAVAADRRALAEPPPLTVAAIINCGFPEARHGSVASAICALFAREAGARWAGALQLGGGGALDGRSLEGAGGLAQHLPAAMDAAAESLSTGRALPAASLAAFRRPLMPTALYIAAADAGWLWSAAHEGALTRLWRRPAERRGG